MKVYDEGTGEYLGMVWVDRVLPRWPWRAETPDGALNYVASEAAALLWLRAQRIGPEE